MEQLAEELTPHKIVSAFIYTHEAHPGENYPHHTSCEQKLRHARAFRDPFEVNRPILVDSLDGACHRAYGSMPNMSWIIDRVGRSVYKADWTDTGSVHSAVQELLGMVERRRRNRLVLSPFRVERLEYRASDRQAFIKGLERAGPKAVTEYLAQIERWRNG